SARSTSAASRSTATGSSTARRAAGARSHCNPDRLYWVPVRLLPRDRGIGYLPYLWLVYLVLFLVAPVLRRASTAEWAVTLAALPVFLVLYFRGYWLEGRRLYPIIAAIAALGALFIWRNPGAVAFFIYAGAFVGHVGPPRTAARVLAGVVALLVICVFAMHLPLSTWLPGAVMTPIIGTVNIRQAQIRRASLASREEIEQSAQTAERERIARDLHDLLGHSLSLIALKSELAAKLAERDPARAAAEIREVEQVSRQALGEVRAAVRGYRSLGLAAELAHAQKALT